MPETVLCVYCRQRPVAVEWRPFCSERCKMADLGRWLAGDYHLASSEEPAGPWGSGLQPDLDDDSTPDVSQPNREPKSK